MFADAFNKNVDNWTARFRQAKLLKKCLLVGSVLLFSGLLAGGVYVLVDKFHPLGLEPWMFRKHILAPLLGVIKKTVFNPIFYIALTLIFTLERIMPAKPQQKIFSLGLAQDAIWMFFEAIFEVTFLAIVVQAINGLYQQYIGFTVPWFIHWEQWKLLLLGIVVTDFGDWLNHYIRHKVPWFWQFHTIHHSQKELNIFTDVRYHFIEYAVAKFINILILLTLGLETPAIVYYVVGKMWFTRTYHGNIKTNFGPLRYILVNPQSHRIHHSNQPQHRDKNFGVVFSIWDHLFGTQYRGYEEYPDTGIEDEEFPHEYSMRGVHLFLTPFLQLIYPFVTIYQSITKKKNLP